MAKYEQLIGAGTQDNVGVHDSDFSAEMAESDLIKLELLRGLILKNVNLSDFELAELTGFPPSKIRAMRDSTIVTKSASTEKPLSWDYVLAFRTGDNEHKNKVKPSRKDLSNKPEDDDDSEWEHGMDQIKYYGQIFNAFWQRLESAKLSVEACRSIAIEDEKNEDEKEINTAPTYKYMFLIVGITESNLKIWADERDADLLIDPVGGVKVGRTRNFALANRTKLADTMAAIQETLDLSNWQYMYGEYSQQANEAIYKHYKRLPDNDDLFTPFDEKTRLRIIYESIIADTNEGGAEIKIADCLLNKKHPLCGVFPLHNGGELDYFNKEWIHAYGVTKWMWCPLSRIRDYFGEPIAFYFAFLQFYMRWLLAPAIVGMVFFIWQMVAKEIAVTGIPLLCFFMIFWSVAFVDFWARAESRYRLMWGMTKFQQKAVARPQFNGEWTHDAVTGLWSEEFPLVKRSCRGSTVYSFVVVWISTCTVAVIYILLQRDAEPNNIYLKIGLGIINAIMIFIFDFIYKKISVYGNEWENHRTEEDFQNAMIYKAFVFKFVNSFSTLFYLGFIRPTRKGLYYYIHFYTAVCGSAAPYMSQFLQLYDPQHKDYEWFNQNIDTNDKMYQECITPDPDGLYTDCVYYVMDDENRNAAWNVVVEGFYPSTTGLCPTNSLISKGEQYDINTGKCYGACDLYTVQIEQNETVLLELRIQLLTLFFTAIVIQNSLEVGIPLLCQRIRKAKASNEPKSILEIDTEKDRYVNTIDDMSELIVQFGYVTLFVMAFPLTPFLAVVNNIIEMKVDATNLVVTSQRPSPDGSYGIGSWNNILGFFSIISVATNVALITWRTKLVTMLLKHEPSGSWIFFSLLSIFLGIVVGMEKWLIPDVPIAVERAIERQRLVESVLILGAGIDIEADEPPSNDDDTIQFDPALDYIEASTLPDAPLALSDLNHYQTQTQIP